MATKRSGNLEVQKQWREKNREKSNEYHKKRREKLQKEMAALKKKGKLLIQEIPSKLEKAQSWEKRYRDLFEKTYGKLEIK